MTGTEVGFVTETLFLVRLVGWLVCNLVFSSRVLTLTLFNTSVVNVWGVLISFSLSVVLGVNVISFSPGVVLEVNVSFSLGVPIGVVQMFTYNKYVNGSNTAQRKQNIRRILQCLQVRITDANAVLFAQVIFVARIGMLDMLARIGMLDTLARIGMLDMLQQIESEC